MAGAVMDGLVGIGGISGCGFVTILGANCSSRVTCTRVLERLYNITHLFLVCAAGYGANVISCYYLSGLRRRWS